MHFVLMTFDTTLYRNGKIFYIFTVATATYLKVINIVTTIIVVLCYSIYCTVLIF